MTPSGLAVPQTPMVNAGELYLNGLRMYMYPPSVEDTVYISAGAARDSKNLNDIVLQQDTTALLSDSGLNGLDTGVPEIETFYAVYVVGSSVALKGNGQMSSIYPIGIMFSKRFDQPYLPAGYDMSRRIGAVLTDSNGDIYPFAQTGNDTTRTMRYGSPFAILTLGTSTAWELIDINNTFDFPLMPTIQTNIYLSASFTSTDTDNSFYLQPNGYPENSYFSSGSAPVINVATDSELVTPVNVLADLAYELDDNSDTLSLIFRGYDDLL